jgi:mono/diheme cytochrome c family protein
MMAQTSAPAASQFPDTSSFTDKVITDGRDVFRNHGGCIVCHGVDLKGIIGPTLLEHTWKDAKNGTPAEIFRVVLSGVAGTSMIARPNGINDTQARNVAAYVWAVNHRHIKP